MELDGKILAIILCGESDGEKEVSAHRGTLRKTGETYEFYRGKDRPSFKLEPHWLDRIRVVPDDVKETLLGADVCLSLTVGPIPNDADLSEYVLTGLRGPPDD